MKIFELRSFYANTALIAVLGCSVVISSSSGLFAQEALGSFEVQGNTGTEARSPDRQKSVLRSMNTLPHAVRVPPQTVVRDGRLITGLAHPEFYLLAEVFRRNEWIGQTIGNVEPELRLLMTGQENELLTIGISAGEGKPLVIGQGFFVRASDDTHVRTADGTTFGVIAVLIRVENPDGFKLSLQDNTSTDAISIGAMAADDAKSLESPTDFLILQSLLIRPALDGYWRSGDPEAVLRTSGRLIALSSPFVKVSAMRDELDLLRKLHADAVILTDARKNLSTSQPNSQDSGGLSSESN